MNDLTIRYALPDDIESICHVHHSVVKAIQNGLYEKNILDAWIAAVTPFRVKERLKLDNSKWFVADVENKNHRICRTGIRGNKIHLCSP